MPRHGGTFRASERRDAMRDDEQQRAGQPQAPLRRRRSTSRGVEHRAAPQTPDTTISTCCACWRAEPDDQQQAGAERADDRADGVRGVDAADQPAGSCPLEATEASASGKLAPQRIAPGSIAQSARTRSSWKLNHGLVEIDGLIGQYGSDCVSMYAAQAMAPHEQHLTPAERQRGRVDAARQRRAEAAADAEADEEDRQDQRERVDGRAEEQRQHARPDHFAASAREARQRDGDVDEPSCLGRAVDPPAVARRVAVLVRAARAARRAARARATSDVQRDARRRSRSRMS